MYESFISLENSIVASNLIVAIYQNRHWNNIYIKLHTPFNSIFKFTNNTFGTNKFHVPFIFLIQFCSHKFKILSGNYFIIIKLTWFINPFEMTKFWIGWASNEFTTNPSEFFDTVRKSSNFSRTNNSTI